jgi:predicted ATP-binding protein involved in virulence
MRIHQLKLEQYRGFSNASLDFISDFTLLVGKNGAGKSSILWALRVALSYIQKNASISKEKLLGFTQDDVANSAVLDWPYLKVAAEFSFTDLPDKHIWFSAQKNRAEFVEGHAGDVRNQVMDTPDSYDFYELDAYQQRIPSRLMQGQRSDNPLAIYYSAHRATITEQAISKPGRTSGNEARAYAEALEDRPVLLTEMTELWRKEVALKVSDGIPDRANQAIQNSLPDFLEGFSDLHLHETKNKPTLNVKKNRIELDIPQLSDGERSMLVILMDLTRRLALANPNLQEPNRNASAVVMIDELDLHLHPKWQRTIVDKLSKTFPKCQFIATTHSPLIVGEVPPENIIILEEGKAPYRPDQSLGMDTNWILRFLMGTDEREFTALQILRDITNQINDENYEKAEEMIAEARKMFRGEDATLIDLQAQIDQIRFLGEE